jgi:PleD family two-component response regulator
MKPYPAASDWLIVSQRLRARLRRKRDGDQLLQLLDRLEVAATLAGREMALEYYHTVKGKPRPH